MSVTVSFRVTDSKNQPISGQGRLHVEDLLKQRHVLEGLPGAPGHLSFSVPLGMVPYMLRFNADAVGFWDMAFPTSEPSPPMCCVQLPGQQQEWWWHEALNCRGRTKAAGAGIKIGVMDTDFICRDGLDHVELIAADGKPAVGKAYVRPAHGEIVCRIIGQPNFGLAPGAEITSVVVDARPKKLNVLNVHRAILLLAHEKKVDLINLSAGLFDNPLHALRSAIREAARAGTLCIVSAGNEAVSGVAYPARYNECVAVGAVGLVDWGPPSSMVRRFSDLRTQSGTLASGQPIFHFSLSAHGDGLDLVAPGVGIVVNRGDRSLFAATGTSYASPMVCGLLARVLADDETYRELPRSQARCDKARAVLKGLCIPTGLAAKYEGHGLPRAP
jgi:subtilisin family serine protease